MHRLGIAADDVRSIALRDCDGHIRTIQARWELKVTTAREEHKSEVMSAFKESRA